MKPRLKSLLLIFVLTLIACLVASAQAEEDRYGVAIDSKPLNGLRSALIRKLKAEEIDLTTPFRVDFEGTRGTSSKGKLVVFRFRVVKSEGGVQQVAMVKDAVAAFGESGLLGYLTQLEATTTKVTLSVVQTSETFMASIDCPTATANRAQATASGLNNIFTLAQMANKSNESQTELLKGITASADGASYRITFTFPASEVHRLIKAEFGKGLAK